MTSDQTTAQFGPLELPPIPPETPATDVLTALGFDPQTTRAVVVTPESVVGVSMSIPDLADPPAAYPGEPHPPTEEAPDADA